MAAFPSSSRPWLGLIVGQEDDEVSSGLVKLEEQMSAWLNDIARILSRGGEVVLQTDDGGSHDAFPEAQSIVAAASQ